MLGVPCNYNQIVNAICQRDCTQALQEEAAATLVEAEMKGEEYKGITMMTDARHGWRRNSRQTDVVCMGHHTHKVLRDEIVTKNDSKMEVL